MTYRIGIDIGGTFTDFTVFREESGEIVLAHKIPSVPENPLDGILDGLRFVKEALPAEPVSHVLHGTTTGINTLLQEKGTDTALITTKGFRDVYDIGRQWRGHDAYNLFIDRPKMLLPRRQIYEVDERVDFRGEVVRPLDTEQAAQVVDSILSKGIRSIAISLIFAFANPEHEKALSRLIAERDPDAFVSLSSEVNPEFREYERTATTVANSYIGAEVGSYLMAMEDRVRQVFPGAPVLIMQSNGGVGTPRMLFRFPVHTIMSGPVAGVIGARFFGQVANVEDLISLDIGGTSCDMSVIPGRLLATSEMSIGRHPIRVPAVDIATLGAGGGSIARLGLGNVLKVGPGSAGAYPGPACYGRGGLEPTVTDALVVLGHLNPEFLLGGRMAIRRDLAERAIVDKVANAWNMTATEAAAGILRVLAAQVAASMRNITIERGYDPRDFTLVAFGGAGPTLACALAQELEIPHVLVPPDPGNFCAFGMLTTELMREKGVTRIGVATDYSPAAIQETFRTLEAAAAADLRDGGMDDSKIEIERLLELRYSGQSYEVPVHVGEVRDEGDIGRIVEAFHEAHARTYGHKAEGEPVELVNFKARAVGHLPKPVLRRFSPDGRASPKASAERDMYFPALSGSRRVPMYHRGELSVGGRLIGPAVIEENTSTTVLYPGFSLTVDEYLNLSIKREQQQGHESAQKEGG